MSTIIDSDQAAAIPDETEILQAVRARLALLRPLVVEHDRLAKADAALDKAAAKVKKYPKTSELDVMLDRSR